MASGWPGVVDRRGTHYVPREAERHPFGFLCPKPHCYLAQAASSESEARHIEATHRCPNQMGTTKIGWYVTMTLVEQLWEELDRALDDFYASPAEMREPKKHYMRGLSFSLTIFMQPHLTTQNQIAEEAVRRRDARLAGDSTYQTIGLNERRYETPPPSREGVPARKSTPPPPAKTFTDTEIATIKQSASLMPLADIARLYGVTEQVIRKLIA